jgi:hypothetical protein
MYLRISGMVETTTHTAANKAATPATRQSRPAVVEWNCMPSACVFTDCLIIRTASIGPICTFKTTR